MRTQDATTLGELSSNELQPWSDIATDVTKWAAAMLALTKLGEKIKEQFPKRKRKGSKRTPEELGKEIDDLRKFLDTLLDVIRQHVALTNDSVKVIQKMATMLGDKQSSFSLASLGSNVGRIAQMVISHDARLEVLDKSIQK